ncbi:SDR family oxidoreductase [Massilia alkalitolerans]|uniref:SDR family oxidoreductase n=1 Tax=Massilia alkalitolerans TaxID=286638 RepID=UPI0028AD3BCD|nr:SDR family oxidoreductase [Massilia alkalitolerans]
MHIQNATVLITGANRGLGAEFARQALARGAKKVYAAARKPESVTVEGVVPVRLDVTDAAAVAALAAELGDVDLVINNAGVAGVGKLLADDSADALRWMLETNVFGILNMSRHFAPVLQRNGGGAFVNVLSVASWKSNPALAGYAVTKAAAWSLSNGVRDALREQGTQVLGVHVGMIDTDLTRGFDLPKLTPSAVVARTFAALETGAAEVLVDEITRAVKQGLIAEPPLYTLA